MKKNKTAQPESQDLRELYKDDRTEERIQEHLNNENDVITEEDIANAPTGIVAGKELPDPEIMQDNNDEALEDEAKQLKEKKIKDNDDPAIETTWNVLGS